MSHTDATIYILAASLIGATIGFFGAALMASTKMRRIEQDSWNKARRFYTHGKQTRRL